MLAQTLTESPRNPARYSLLLARLFPPGVGTGELREPGDSALLYPEERWAARAFDSRRLAAFSAGRLCARRAVAGVGFVRFPIGVNTDRSPRWPDSVVGSITRAVGFCGAVAANRFEFDAVGIDAETIGQVSNDVWPEIFTPAEIEALRARRVRKQTQAATIMFSAKEALFACRARALAGLGFHDVAVTFVEHEVSAGSFQIRPGRAGVTMPAIEGSFRIDGALVVTGVALGATSGAQQSESGR